MYIGLDTFPNGRSLVFNSNYGKKLKQEPAKRFDNNMELPSRFQRGDKVSVDLEQSGTIKYCKIHNVKFTGDGKVLYDINVIISKGGRHLENDYTRIYNIDSAFVKERKD